jgi:hypothetical protein
MFTSNRCFWLDASATTFLIRDNSGLRRESKRPRQSRMERDRWVLKKGSIDSQVFEKTVRAGSILRRIGWSGGYELEQPGECKLAFPAWEWADWDRQRLVWAESGCLLSARLGSHKLGTIRTLYDFNGMVPVLREKTSP